MFLFFICFCTSCNVLTGVTITKELLFDSNSCFTVFSSTLSTNSSINISFDEDMSNFFFGIDNNDTPGIIKVTQNDISSTTENINYQNFMKDIPVFCNADLTEEKLSIIEFAKVDGKTSNGYPISLSLNLNKNYSKYSSLFGHPGNCAIISRRIYKVDDSGVSVGTCLGIFLGLGLSTGLITFCIIVLNPMIQKSHENAIMGNAEILGEERTEAENAYDEENV